MEYIISFLLIILSAAFSGLTLGFFTLSNNDLKRKAGLGDKKAKKIYQVRKNGNFLLAVLLIGNTAVNASLSVFLGSITSGIIGVLIATSLIVIFGEIIPQSIFARYALNLGGKFVWLIKIFMIVLFPVAWPMAWILNKVLGKELPTIYTKKELVKIIEEHEDSVHSEIDMDEEKILKGGLSYADKTVKDIMTPKVKMILLPSDTKLTTSNISLIRKYGHSRIPVFEKNKNNIVSILYVKDLIGLTSRIKTVGEIARDRVISVDPLKPLDDLLNKFKKTRNHLFVVRDEKERIRGIVTIEDVIEEIIGDEIIDEFDVQMKK